MADYERLCAFCGERPRSKWGGSGSYGFCWDSDCQASREVADALQREERIKSGVERGLSDKEMTLRMYTRPEKDEVLRRRGPAR